MSRFLYIDSKGKEVPIPSVDALALRIELGAVTEATQFYDSASDRWAPAGEHEVFRSLQREAQEKSAGFVAPPPPPMPPPPVFPPAEKSRAPNPFESIEGPAAPPAQPAEPAPPAPNKHDVFGGLDLGLTLDDSALATPESEPEPPPAASPEEEAPTFEFQGFGGAEEEEGADGEEERAPELPSAAVDDGLAIEGVLAASYDLPGSGGAVSGERIETEGPLADLGSEAASSWAQRDEAAAPAPRRPASGGGDRPPRARPAAPAAKEPSRLPMGLVAGIVLLLVAGGGFFAWRSMQGDGDARVAVAEGEIDPPVTIPALAAELEPRMREVAALALADWVVAVRDTFPVQRGIAPEPDPAWLGGEYMADAGRFGSVAAYWRELDAYVDRTLAEEQEIYEGFLEVRLVDSTGVADARADVIAERAAAGFQANRPRRRDVYRQLRAVIDAAAGLHEFLVDNEERIDYQPGPERDPVLEAVPETPELGDEMWSRVDGITAALDGLGALDKVTTERLLALATAKIQAIGVQ